MQLRLNARACLLLLTLIVLGIYYPALFAPLNSVDDQGMVSYLLNTDHFSLRSIFWPGGSGSYYRPLLLSSFLLDKYLWGLDESFMHLENVVFHLCNTLMVFALARRGTLLQRSGSVLVPFLTALFFAVHPINTESVNWISGRTDLLTAFFLLLSAFLLMKTPPRVAPTALAALSMLAACLVKETAIFFLPAILLLPFFFPCDASERRSLQTVAKKNLAHFFFFFGSGIGYFAFRALAFKRGDTGVATVVTHVAGDQGAGIAVVLRLVFKATGFYLKKLLVPFPLNFGITHVSDWYLPLGLVVALATCWQLKRRNLSAFFYLCAFSVACSALMIPLLRMTWTPLGERYMYIPSAFFLMGVSFEVSQWLFTPRLRLVFTATVVALLGVSVWGTSQRTLLWQDNLALFQDTLKKSPDFVPAQNEIANALWAGGKHRQAKDIYEAFVNDPKLVNFQYGLINKAFALTRDGKYSAAREVLRQALADPGKREVEILKQMLEVNKYEVLQGGGSPAAVYQDNVKVLSRLSEITGDPFYQYRLGVAHLQAGHREKALEACRIAAAKAPRDAYYRHAAEQLTAKLEARPELTRTAGEQR